MTLFQIYLEIGDEGECLAHILDLPGCVLRGESLAEVLDGMPDAIRAYMEWLRRHGESVEETDALELRVVEINQGFGPFRRGDRAALFPADLLPPTRDEMENLYFKYANYARHDLFELVRKLPEQVLDWRMEKGAMTIREILRHIGNAEQWYISRLVPAETLPKEWEVDADMPILEFLELERRTGLERLRQLSEDELSAITHPVHWTKYPEEPWTARKALRRLVEHEIEHIAHIREILNEYENA
jgi:antitoxin HicB